MNDNNKEETSEPWSCWRTNSTENTDESEYVQQISQNAEVVQHTEETLQASGLSSSINNLSLDDHCSSSLSIENVSSRKNGSSSFYDKLMYSDNNRSFSSLVNSSTHPGRSNNESGAVSKKTKPFARILKPEEIDKPSKISPIMASDEFPGPPPPTPIVSIDNQDKFLSNLPSLSSSHFLCHSSNQSTSLTYNSSIDSNITGGAIRKSVLPISYSNSSSTSNNLSKNDSVNRALDPDQIVLEPSLSQSASKNDLETHHQNNSSENDAQLNEGAVGGIGSCAVAFCNKSYTYLPVTTSYSSKLPTSNLSGFNTSLSARGAMSTSIAAAADIASAEQPSISLGNSHNLSVASSNSNNVINLRPVIGDHSNSVADNETAPIRPPPVHNVKGGPVYNWQATLTSVKERFAFLFNNEILSDVQFVVGRGEEEQTIPAHKFVLAVGSAVFDAMFNGLLASEQQVINLPDVEPQAFLSLLSFLYSDEVQIGPETVMTVLYTAKKYAVPALERRCVDFLKTNLSPDNAFMLLTQARLFDEPQLAALCLKTIDKCTAEAIVAEGFTDIDHDTLTLVLQRDTLRIKELHLYQAVCRWAEAECIRQGLGVLGRQQRFVLSHALKLIRFPLMTVEEFAQGPAQSNILTDAEVVQLFLYFSVNPKPSVDFIDVPRCCMTGKEQTVNRFQSIEARWGYSGTPDRIRFIVDRRIFVVGFGMYGSIHGPSEYEVTVQLIHTLTGKVCGSNETVFTSDGTYNAFRVMFPDPIEVLPNTNYTAYATLRGPDSHYGTKGLRKVVVECPSGDRVCFQFSYAAGNNNGTSVEDGQIPEIIFYT